MVHSFAGSHVKWIWCYCVYEYVVMHKFCLQFQFSLSKLQHGVAMGRLWLVICALPLLLSSPPPPANRMSDAKLQKTRCCYAPHISFSNFVFFFAQTVYFEFIVFLCAAVTVFSLHDKCCSSFDESETLWRRFWYTLTDYNFTGKSWKANNNKKMEISNQRDSSSNTSGDSGGGGGVNIFSLAAVFSLVAQRITSNQ